MISDVGDRDLRKAFHKLQKGRFGISDTTVLHLSVGQGDVSPRRPHNTEQEPESS